LQFLRTVPAKAGTPNLGYARGFLIIRFGFPAGHLADLV